jgi:hypothetical protein
MRWVGYEAQMGRIRTYIVGGKARRKYNHYGGEGMDGWIILRWILER